MWHHQPLFKMSLLHYRMVVMAVIFLLYCLMTGFANENSTLLSGNNTSTGCNVDVPALNRTNTSTVCHKLEVDKSQIEEVLRLTHLPTTNTVQLKVSVAPGNRSRNFPEMTWPWASELGRTIISLVARAKESIFTSPIFTTVLTAGTEEVNIRVIEDPYGCLPTGKNGSDMIFDFLLHQLSENDGRFHDNEDEDLYKLCRKHVNNRYTRTMYNCCRIMDGGKLTICRDYSSVVVEFARPTLIVVFVVSFFMVLPFLLQYIMLLKPQEFYKTSESHMSLFSITSMLFFEGSGPVKSLFRRAVFVGFSLLVFLPDFYGHYCLKLLFISWAVVFALISDILMIDGSTTSCLYSSLVEKIIFYVTFPVSCFPWKGILEYKFDCCGSRTADPGSRIEDSGGRTADSGSRTADSGGRTADSGGRTADSGSPIEDSGGRTADSSSREDSDSCKDCQGKLKRWLKDCVIIKGLSFVYVIWILFWIFAIIPVLAIVGLLIFTLHFSATLLLNSYYCVFVDNGCCRAILAFFANIFLITLRLLTLIIIVFCTGMISISAISIVVGFCLNGEYFSPFVAPILTLTVYFWKNWKFFVEAQCLQLKTSIIEVCREKEKNDDDDDQSFNNDSTAENNHSDNPDELTFIRYFLRDTQSCCTSCTKTDEQTNGSVYKEMRRVGIENTYCAGDQLSQGQPGNSAETFSTSTMVHVEEENNDGSPQPESENEDLEKLFIEFDEDGEAKISKILYKEVEKSILRLDHLLFYFFRRITFVSVYSFIMFNVIIVVRASGASGSLQAISTIVAALIPFVFDTSWAENMIEQKNAKNEATKQKLELLLKVHKRERNKIVVELIKNA